MQPLADSEHPIVRRKADDLTAGAVGPLDKLNRIFLFVRDGIEFGFPPEGDLVKASQTIKRGYGHCNTKGILFLALCRAAGLEARFHVSRISKEIQKGLFTGLVYWLLPKEFSHGWVEVEIDGRWHRIDSYINDLPFHRAAVRELQRRGWTTGFSVSAAGGEPSADLVLDEGHFSQMGAVTGDIGTFDSPVRYFAGSENLNRPDPFRDWLYRRVVPLVNDRIRRLRAQVRVAETT